MLVNALAFVTALVLADPAKPQFVVEARLIENDKTLFAPKIAVPEGQSASFIHETQTPFVTSIKTTRQGTEPVITVLKEGLSLAITVTATDLDRVSLDATIQYSTLGDVRELPADSKGTIIQLPKLETIQLRAFEVVRLGEKISLSCDKASNRSVEFVVRRYNDRDEVRKLPQSEPPRESIETKPTSERP